MWQHDRARERRNRRSEPAAAAAFGGTTTGGTNIVLGGDRWHSTSNTLSSPGVWDVQFGEADPSTSASRPRLRRVGREGRPGLDFRGRCPLRVSLADPVGRRLPFRSVHGGVELEHGVEIVCRRALSPRRFCFPFFASGGCLGCLGLVFFLWKNIDFRVSLLLHRFSRSEMRQQVYFFILSFLLDHNAATSNWNPLQFLRWFENPAGMVIR